MAATAGLEPKKAIVADFSAQLRTAEAVIIAENGGLSVADLSALRSRLRESGGRLSVVKNTLARRALDGTPFDGLSPNLRGPLLYGVSPDPAALAKTLAEFGAQNKRLSLKGGAMPNTVLDAAGVAALAKLPGREVLLAELARTMRAPISTFVRALADAPARFARVLAAVRDLREKNSSS